VFSTVQESEHGYFEGDGDFLQGANGRLGEVVLDLAEKAGAEPDLLTEFAQIHLQFLAPFLDFFSDHGFSLLGSEINAFINIIAIGEGLSSDIYYS
jgi:hypothetical protein